MCNTTNKGGGACTLRAGYKIKEVCVANNLKFHLDGAYLEYLLLKQDPKAFGKILIPFLFACQRARSIIGSVLLADKATIHRALHQKYLEVVCVRLVIWLQPEFML
jgi:threonine aldolase